MKLYKYIFLAGLTFSSLACDELLEFEPGDEILADEALQDGDDLQALLNSAYDVLRGGGAQDGHYLGGRYQAISEVMGDNIDGTPGNLDNADLLAYYNKTTSIFTGYTQNMFDEPHYVIYRANTLLDLADQVPNVDEADRERIKGEARFLRAITYFDLVRLFAQPYGYTPDNSHLGVVLRTSPNAAPSERNTVAEVYTQIVEDLQTAIALLPTSNGVYADVWAAKGLLAKVRFQMHMYEEAYALADDVIENGPYAFVNSTEEYMDRYSPAGSPEAVFKLASSANDNRGVAFGYNFRSDGPNLPTLKISRDLYNVATANENDFRGQIWYAVNNEGQENEQILLTKFDDKDEDPAYYFDVPLLTVTELKLIRAEAAAELGQTAVALADLNDIRERASLATASLTEPEALINLIREERRKEFVGEGVRFHDLRRIGASGEDILIRGSNWDCPGMAVQFPDGEVAGAGGTEFFTLNPEGGC